MVLFDIGREPLHSIDGNFTLIGIWPQDYDPRALRALFGNLPAMSQLEKSAGPTAKAKVRPFGVLRAYDPVKQKIIWEQPFPQNTAAGVMTTAGNLVFQGDPNGMLSIFAADTGKVLDRIELGTSIIAAPMTYSVNGTQYVAVTMQRDVQAAVAFLKSRNNVATGRIGIAGASLGANLACWSPPVTRRSDRSPCSRRATITRACGSRLPSARWTAGCCSSQAPTTVRAFRSASALAGTGSGREMLTLTDAGHGTTMLLRQPDLAGRLVDWFRRTLL